jgi:hypothetical protein
MIVTPCSISSMSEVATGDRPGRPVVANAAERIERAKADWSEGRIPSVTGDTERGTFPPSL